MSKKRRWTPQPEVVKRKRSYGQVTPKKIYEICLKAKRIPPYEKIVELLALEGIYVKYDTVKRAVRKLKAGAKIDHMGDMDTLEAQIDVERASHTPEDVTVQATGEMFQTKEDVLKQTEGYISGIKRTLNRVKKILGKPDPRTWTRLELMTKVFNPMLNDLDPFIEDPDDKEKMLPPQKCAEWSVLTINGVAVNIRRLSEHLNRPVDQGGLMASYKQWNQQWSETHDGRRWRAPRTWLKRTDYKEFREALLSANPQRFSKEYPDWSLGRLMQVVIDVQIVTGMRERKETLLLPFERIMTREGKLSDNVSYVSAKKSETWEDLPLRLFNDLCYVGLGEWFKYARAHGAEKLDRVFPISYNIYREAIVRARSICKFEEHDKITGHACRRTHATWLRIGGASHLHICGKEPKGWLGVGWKTPQTLTDHYMCYEEEEIDNLRITLAGFNPLGKLTEAQEKLAQRYETGRLEVETKED